MSIKRVAEKRRSELLLSLSPDGTFKPWTYGDLATVDRFLSNFHKPLQRRMLHIDPKTEIPETGVVLVKSTNEIYLISEPRDDASDNESYDRLCVLHHVSGTSGGAVEVFNYERNDSKPTTSIAEYDKVSIGTVYLAIEYFSSKKAENSDEYYEGKFVIYSPTGTPLKKDSVFSFGGNNYKILQEYVDSSYSCALAIQQADDMQTIKYISIDSGSGYDVSTGELTLNEVEYLFSGTIDFDSTDAYGLKKSTVYVKATELPFNLLVGRYVEDSAGFRSKILEVSRDTNAGGQFKLRCEG